MMADFAHIEGAVSASLVGSAPLEALGHSADDKQQMALPNEQGKTSDTVEKSASGATPVLQPIAPPTKLDVGDLNLGNESFDPKRPPQRAQLMQHLGLSSGATIEAQGGFCGGLNEGVWIVSNMEGKEDMVLKLVRSDRIVPTILSESENFLKLAQNFPMIASDTAIAFPTKILYCLGPGGVKRNDLIVMKKVPGRRLSELIAHKWYSKQVPALMTIFEKLGGILAKFHDRYGGVQHGDFQSSNVFYDEEGDQMSLIDMGGMCVKHLETDVEHFAKSMKILSDAYGSTLLTDGLRAFKRGYAKFKSEDCNTKHADVRQQLAAQPALAYRAVAIPWPTASSSISSRVWQPFLTQAQRQQRQFVLQVFR